MTDPKVSEGMSNLVADFLASIVCYEHAQDKISFDDMTLHGNALLSAIAEIEQRAEKWKAVALAAETMTSFHNQSLANAIAALGDEWDEAVR